MKKYLFILPFYCLYFSIYAQTDSIRLANTLRIDSIRPEFVAPVPKVFVASVDSVATDSLPTAKQSFLHRMWKSDYPNPKKALAFSFILPGSGQLYNRKYWKVPIIYGGLGTLIFVEQYNLVEYRKFKRNYKNAVDGNPLTRVDAAYQDVSADQLKRARDKGQKAVESIGMGIGLLYIFVAADAYVDAHLASFDVSDDLSLRLRPGVQNNSIGLVVALTFR